MQKVGDTGDISLLCFLAGANFWAILGHFGNFGSFLCHFGQFWVILGHFWAIFCANFFWPKMYLCYFYNFLHLCGGAPLMKLKVNVQEVVCAVLPTE